MKRPLLIVALLYGGGILWANFLPLPRPPFVLPAAGIIVALLCLFCSRVRPVFVWPLLVLAGAVNFTLRTAILSPDDLRVVAPADAEIVVVRGRLTETPYHRVFEHEEEPSWRTIAMIDVESLQRKDGPLQRAAGTVVVSTPDRMPERYFGGRRVAVEGVLRRPESPVVQGQFDYPTYLRRHGIYRQLQVSSVNDWRLADESAPPSRPLADRFGAWAKGILARGLPVEDEPLRLLWAMTLGWRTALNGEVAEPFMRSGTMHVFAISGLHIALIAGLLVAVLRVFKVPRAVTGAMVVPLIWFYTYATGWQPSAIRSTIMMTVVLGGWSLRRPNNLLNSLAAAAFIILLWDPQQLFQASFQLSFCVVLSMALVVPLFNELRQPFIDPTPDDISMPVRKVMDRIPLLRELIPDPLLPRKLWPRWQRVTSRVLRFGWGSFLTSLAAWLGSVPLIAYYFNLLTPVSLLANMVVVPLSSAALACNLASLTVGGWFPACAELFNHSAWFFMLLMIRLSEWAAATPGGCLHVATPSPALFGFYYAALVLVMTGWVWKPRIRLWAAGALLLLGGAALWGWQSQRAITRLTLIPLNGGEAIYFAGRNGREELLIDCGNASAAQFVVKPFLRSQGVTRLDQLLLTHGDVRHVGGAEFIRRQFGVRRILFGAASFRSAAYKEVQTRLAGVPGLCHTVRRGDRLGPWEVLHPAGEQPSSRADDTPVVLRADIDRTSILLLSDLGKPGQNALMAYTNELRSDLVVAGLPSQSEPLADALLDAIRPRAIVITDSLHPASARAGRHLRERLASRSIPVFYTSEAGAITVELSRQGWQLRTASRILLRSSPGEPR